MMKNKYLAFKDLEALGIPYTRTHIWRLMRQGKFPQRCYLGGQRTVRWEASVIRDWLKNSEAPALKPMLASKEEAR